MRFSEYPRLFYRSALGIGSLFLAAGAGAVAFPLGLGAAGAAGLAAGTAAGGFLLGLATGLGPRLAAREAERLAESRNAASRAAMAADRERLAALRLAEPGLAAARGLLVLEAGRFLDLPGRPASPTAAAALEEALALLDAWQREADESAIERRFGSPDAHPFPEAAARTAEALRDKARLVAREREASAGLPLGEESLAIDKELS